MKTLQISEETYEKIKNQLQEGEKFKLDTYDDFVGQKWFFRTVAYHWIGKVTKRIGSFLWLEEAVCVFDSGRLMQAIRNGELEEYEETGEAIINLAAVNDAIPWRHSIPKGQK